MNDIWYTYGTFMRTYVQSVYMYIICIYVYHILVYGVCNNSTYVYVYIHMIIYVRIYKIWLWSIVCLVINKNTCLFVYAYIYICIYTTKIFHRHVLQIKSSMKIDHYRVKLPSSGWLLPAARSPAATRSFWLFHGREDVQVMLVQCPAGTDTPDWTNLRIHRRLTDSNSSSKLVKCIS